MKRMVAIFLILLVLLTGCGSGAASVPTLTPTDASTETPLPPTNTPEPTATPTLAPGDTAVRESDGMVMVYVPAGEFIMGIDPEEAMTLCEDSYFYCNENDYESLSTYRVSLDAFWIDQTEVTWEQYLSCVQDGVCQLTQGQAMRCLQDGDCGVPVNPDDPTGYYQPALWANYIFLREEYVNHPVVSVNWFDAQTYCDWAGVRLPTSVEWVKAARGTNGQSYPWGEMVPDSTLANFNHTGDTTVIGSYPNGASPYGALDMAGNVSEWVADWAGEDYNTGEIIVNPQGPETGTQRLMMGCSWFCDAYNTHLGWQGTLVGINPAYWDILYGFRCASSDMP